MDEILGTHRPARTVSSPASSSCEGAGEGEGWASAGTTTMIDDHRHKIKSGTPPRTRKAQPASNAQLNRPPRMVHIEDWERGLSAILRGVGFSDVERSSRVSRLRGGCGAGQSVILQ